MSKDLAIFEELRDIVASRVNYYNKMSKNDWTMLGSATAYQSCLDMIEYALDDNWDCLKEFDYYEN